MNILLETPTWLGDSVMTTPAIENIVTAYPNAKLTIFGAKTGVAIFKAHPNVVKIVNDNSRYGKNRWLKLRQIAKSLGQFDAVLSFRRQFSSQWFVFCVKARLKGNYQRYDKVSKHQVLRYNDFINQVFDLKTEAGALKIYQQTTADKADKTDKILGINPGASYGNAKRWYPDKFAQVINKIAHNFDEVIIFGGENEMDIAGDIVKKLTIKNYQNLAGKTSIETLIDKVAQLNLFITGDSGPMHLAAAFSVPSVAIFGPTNDKETSAWMNGKSAIVKQNFSCQPCMQRTCPLKGDLHHQCMKSIDASSVLECVNAFLKP